MSDAKTSGSAKGGLVKKLGVVVGVLAVLLVAAYFVGTSAWFLKSVVLPKAGKSLNASITVEDASISPFSSVKLTGLKVQTTGMEPVLSAQEVSVRYPSLFDLIGGQVVIDEIALAGVTVNVAQNADGTSNLDPLLKSPQATPSTPSATPSKPLRVDLRKLAINGAHVRYQQTAKDGGKMTAELNNVNATLTDLGNGKTGGVNLKADLKVDQALNEFAKGAIEAGVNGDIKVQLTEALMPAAINGTAGLKVGQATGALKDLAQLSGDLRCDWTPTEIKGVSLKFAQAGKNLGALAVSGPFDAGKLEGKLKAEVTAIDRQVLNLAGASFGIDFNSTTVNAASEIELAQGGQKISATGSLNVARLSLTQKGQTTPEMDVQAKYDVAVDQAQKSVQLNAFTLSGLQKQTEVIRGSLSRPMNIEWGKGSSNAVDESALELAVNNLNLADWRAFVPSLEPAGRLSLKLNLLSQRGGNRLVVDATGALADFAARQGTNQIQNADIDLAFKSTLEDFARANLEKFDLAVAYRKQPVLRTTGFGLFNTKTQDAEIQTRTEVQLATAAGLAGMPALKVSGGVLEFNGRVVQKNTNPAQTVNPPFDRAIAGKLDLKDFSGSYDQVQFDRFAISADAEVAMKNDLAQIQRLKATLSQSGQLGGTVEASGQYDLAKSSGQVRLKLADLNQTILKSVAALLAPNKLETVEIGATLDMQYDAKGASGAKGDVKIVNLLITDPAGQLPRVPMTAETKLDVSLKDQLADIRQFNGAIKQGQLNGGTFEVSGRANLAKTNGQFAIKVADLNQHALKPLLASIMGDKSLESVSINADVKTQYDVAGESAVKGALQVVNLLVNDPKGLFPKEPMTAETQIDAGFKPPVAEIRRFTGSIKAGEANGGQFDVTGRFDLAKTNGQFSAKVVDLNQTALRPLLASTLGDLTLESVSINVNANAKLDLNNESSVKGDLKVAKLLVKDPKNQLPTEPLEAGLSVDGSMKNQVLDLRAFGLQLSPTARAKNQVNLSGQLNLANTSAIAGDLRLNADSIDLTPWYDLYANQPAGTPATAPTQPPTDPNEEPAPTSLPFRNFAVQATVGQLYLRDLAVTNLAANLRIDGGRVDLSNAQLSLNGAPVTGRALVDLSVPGYTYDTALDARQIKLSPLISSFAPLLKETVKGELTANLAVKGAGVTGKSLRQHLTGNVSTILTNAAIVPQDFIKTDPGAKKDFFSALFSEVSALLLIIGQVLGVPNVVAEPIDSANLDLQLGGGRIDLTRLYVHAENIILSSAGTIPIADVLTNSPLDLPVEVSVSRKTASALSIITLSEQATHAKLPKFVTVKGTLGDPDPKIKGTGLLGTAASQIGRKVDGTAGGILQGIGGLFGGKTEAVTNAPPTTGPSTNAPVVKPESNQKPASPLNLLDQLLKPKPKN